MTSGDTITDLTAFNNFFNTHNTTIYYPLSSPYYTLLDDTIGETLDKISNDKYVSYSPQTNITQTNADLPFVITANGIKAYENI